MISIFQDELNKTQEAVLNHLTTVLGAEKEQVHYYKQKRYIYEDSSVDIVIIEPTSISDYFVVSTIGLSNFDLSKNIRNEIVMVLPNWWKPNHPDYEWPFALLKDIVESIRDDELQFKIFSIFKSTNEYDVKGGECVGGIIIAPEVLPEQLFNLKFEDKNIFFLQLLPITSYQFSKINEVGVDKFVEFDLHDSEGNFTFEYASPVKSKTISSNPTKGPIDKIIDHNEGSLLD